MGSIPVEEDGDEIFAPIPEVCAIWNCKGSVRPEKGFHKCDKCGTSYGRVHKSQANGASAMTAREALEQAVQAIESTALANHLSGRHDRFIPTFHTCKDYTCKNATSALKDMLKAIQALQQQPDSTDDTLLTDEEISGVDAGVRSEGQHKYFKEMQAVAKAQDSKTRRLLTGGGAR